MVKPMNLIRSCFLVVFLLMTNSLFADSLVAKLDRSLVDYGQSVTLTVTASGVNGELDLSSLEKDFDVINTMRSSSVQIVNGQMNKALIWQLTLMPLHEGVISIESFEVEGERSSELKLKVNPAGQGTVGNNGRDFFIELSVDNNKPYVQEQVILTARIYQARNIVEGSLTDPQGDRIILERLGADQSYNIAKKGREYMVIERRYVLFAQESGELKIPPLRLTASVKKQRGANRGFFSEMEQVHVLSNPVSINVKPRPESVGWWLPAASVSLTANWETDLNNVSVGEPITRTLSLSAKGSHSTQLPAIPQPMMATAKIYPDQPEMTNQPLDDGMMSHRIEKWAIIPQKAGDLEIPELIVPWYDTVNQKMEEVVIPAQTISIAAAKGEAASPQVISSKAQQTNTIADEPHVNVVPEGVADPLWKWLAIAFCGLWLVTLGLWWYSLTQRKKIKLSHTKPLIQTSVASFKEIESACKTQDSSKINQALLAWSKQQWPEKYPHSLKELAHSLDADGDLFRALANIDASNYSAGKQALECDGLVAKIKEHLKRNRAIQKSIKPEEAVLPEL